MKILVFNTCGLHLGYLGCYGNEWIATPNLDRLASESVVFDQHVIDTPITAPATGEDWLAAAHRALDRLDATEVLHLTGPSLAAPWSIPDDLLNSYTEDDEIEPWRDPPDEIGDDESLLRVQDTYAAAVTWFDAQFGRLLADIDSRRWANDVLLVFTASSGYPLGEHGRLGWESPWLHEELIHVPLIVRCPGHRFAGDRIGALTQPADLAAALRDWPNAGIAALIHGTAETIRLHAIATQKSAATIRTLEWSLLTSSETPLRQLYVKPDDRWEANDLAERELERVAELESLLGEPATTRPQNEPPA